MILIYQMLVVTAAGCVRLADGGYDIWRTRRLACYLLLCAYVRINFCRMQVLRFFVRAIYYQFVKIVLRTYSPR